MKIRIFCLFKSYNKKTVAEFIFLEPKQLVWETKD